MHKKCICAIRICVVILASFMELVLAVFCLAIGDIVDSSHDPPEVIFLAMHASEVLVVVGIIATSLWLPWEDYTKAWKETMKNMK